MSPGFAPGVGRDSQAFSANFLVLGTPYFGKRSSLAPRDSQIFFPESSAKGSAEKTPPDVLLLTSLDFLL